MGLLMTSEIFGSYFWQLHTISSDTDLFWSLTELDKIHELIFAPVN